MKAKINSSIQILPMLPEEFKNGGENLLIKYSFTETQFGKICIASTAKGICSLFFLDYLHEALRNLFLMFPKAVFLEIEDDVHTKALEYFVDKTSPFPELTVHLKATDFQLKVWEKLLQIPVGSLVSYGSIAAELNMPSASRAVGNAVARNLAAVIIPCHRIVQNSGKIGGYRWGIPRKEKLILWERDKS